MSRYREANCKLCRRSREKLFLKGARCYSAKCAIEKRNYPPGHHAGGSSRRLSEYGMRLREKQKCKWFYGVTEKQHLIIFKEANRQKGVTGHNLLALFEQRLDNVVYRVGLASSRKEARQLVLHGHFAVNDTPVNVPSIILRPDAVITVAEKSQPLFKPRFEVMGDVTLPTWLAYEAKTKSVKTLHQPKRTEIDVPFQESHIVEYYSQKG